MTLLMVLMSLMQALRYPVSRLSATGFHKVASCSSRDDASHVHSLHLGESVRSWTSFLPRLPAWREEKKVMADFGQTDFGQPSLASPSW